MEAVACWFLFCRDPMTLTMPPGLPWLGPPGGLGLVHSSSLLGSVSQGTSPAVSPSLDALGQGLHSLSG